MFAGNIFDLGCKATTDAYHEVTLRTQQLHAAGFTLLAVQPAARCSGLVARSRMRQATPTTATTTFLLLLQGGIDFHTTRDKLVPRPWVVDDLDPLLDRLCRWALPPVGGGQASGACCIRSQAGHVAHGHEGRV